MLKMAKASAEQLTQCHKGELLYWAQEQGRHHHGTEGDAREEPKPAVKTSKAKRQTLEEREAKGRLWGDGPCSGVEKKPAPPEG